MAKLESRIEIVCELRPCECNGSRAYFHRWVESEEILIKFNIIERADVLKAMADSIRKDGVIPVGVSTEKIKCLKGLVELENGTVELINPEQIAFMDREVANNDE